jgi:hypothetical protein
LNSWRASINSSTVAKWRTHSKFSGSCGNDAHLASEEFEALTAEEAEDADALARGR